MAKRKPKKLTTKGMQEKLFSILLPVAERFAKQQEEQAKRDAEWRKAHPVEEGTPLPIPVFPGGFDLAPSPGEKARTSRDFLQAAQAAALLGQDDLVADLVARAKAVLTPVSAVDPASEAAAEAARDALMAGAPGESKIEGAAAMEFMVPDHDTLNLLGLRKALGGERGQVLQIDVEVAITSDLVPVESVEFRVNDKWMAPEEVKQPFFLWNDDLIVRNLGDHTIRVRVHYRLAPEAKAAG